MKSIRIYKITSKDTGGVSLVKAGSQAQAMSHVAKSEFAISVATAMEVADLVSAGIKVEDAAKEETTVQIAGTNVTE